MEMGDVCDRVARGRRKMDENRWKSMRSSRESTSLASFISLSGKKPERRCLSYGFFRSGQEIEFPFSFENGSGNDVLSRLDRIDFHRFSSIFLRPLATRSHTSPISIPFPSDLDGSRRPLISFAYCSIETLSFVREMIDKKVVKWNFEHTSESKTIVEREVTLLNTIFRRLKMPYFVLISPLNF